MGTPRTDAAGFTLVESMIALFLISFIVGEMAMVTIGATRSTHYAKQVTKANMYADEALEKSRNTAYASLQLAIGGLDETCSVTANVSTCTSVAPLEGMFTRVRIVRPLDAANAVTTLASSKKADVVATVTFSDARGEPHRVSVASVMTNF